MSTALQTIDKQQAAVVLCIVVACHDKIYLKIGEIKMIGFILGLFLGAFIGVAVMCLCNAASKADEDMERLSKKTSNVKKDSGIDD